MEEGFFNVLNRACGKSGLDCYTYEIFKAAAPIAAVPAVLGVAAAVVAYVKHRWDWNTDVREHCQSIMSRQQLFNVTLLAIGVISSAVCLIKSAGLALAATTSATVFGGIWLSVGVCLVLNNLLHSRMVEQNAMKMV